MLIFLSYYPSFIGDATFCIVNLTMVLLLFLLVTGIFCYVFCKFIMSILIYPPFFLFPNTIFTSGILSSAWDIDLLEYTFQTLSKPRPALEVAILYLCRLFFTSWINLPGKHCHLVIRVIVKQA